MVDDYIAQFDGEVQKCLIQIRNSILDEAPQAEESISYGMLACILHGHPPPLDLIRRVVRFRAQQSEDVSSADAR